MKSEGIIRLLGVYIICITIIFYNGIKGFSFKEETIEIQNNTDFSVFEEQEITQEAPLENNTPSKKEETPKPQSSASEEVSAEAIKGEIISRYISPYTAPLSYNGAYMKNSTDADINIKELIGSALSFKIKQTDEPQVLIVHTHATETFMESDSQYYYEGFNSRTTDNNKNMVKIGSIIAEKLNNAGIVTLHSAIQHDYPKYSGSYQRSAETIYSYLKKYPSIKIVLDLHRDAISEGDTGKVKLVTEIEGKKAAQVMLVMGSETGGVGNFPNWKENLKLALKLQQTMENKYPTLARPLSLMSKSYNQSITTGSLLIEFGTDGNTLEEASNSAELVGNSLVTLFNNLKE